ncbi:hypothetical protein P171DRAFT_3381 [Karstenula rhodostoma CBS 690.94]|uniref:Rhodopsin domain-containing protein n=1 Tax=Karstenula rhodostoma CBS 690.94 TaxID=1392251 RepID=A0A9P4PVZ6_9PLEO|nr:hypothetical protein P171DRAFT_3381 [Karstenula rhodostoma CBS 690.94]
MVHISHFGVVTIATNWLFVTIALGTVILAVLLSLSRRRTWLNLEDCITVIALTIGVALACQTTWAIVLEGHGEHQHDFRNSQINVLARSLVVHEILWIAANGMIRITAYALILRIFIPTREQSKLWWTVMLLLSLSIIYAVVAILEVLLTCRPLAAQWNPAAGTCGNQKVAFLAIEIAGLILDLPLFLIPAKVIAGLRISGTKKMTVMFIFQIGSIVIVVKILRLKSLNLAVSPDFIYAKSYLGLLSTVGTMTSITLAQMSLYRDLSIPAYRLWTWQRRRWHSIYVAVRIVRFTLSIEFSSMLQAVDPIYRLCRTRMSQVRNPGFPGATM